MLPRLPRRQQQMVLILFFVFVILYLRSRSASPPSSYPWSRSGITLKSHLKAKRRKDLPQRNTVVLASDVGADTSWVEEDLPDWDHAIYVVDKKLTDRPNSRAKGREANAYLRYIIDNYHRLSDVTVFVHGKREAFQVDRAFSSNPNSIRRLRVGAVKQLGYQSMSCWGPTNCVVDKLSFWNSAKDNKMPSAFRELFDLEMPELISGPAYSQFAVSREAILARPRADYQHMQSWLVDSGMESSFGAWIMEHLWHYIFGKDPVHCQLRSECLCTAFDLCDKRRPEVRTALKAYGHVEDAEGVQRQNQKKGKERKRESEAEDDKGLE